MMFCLGRILSTNFKSTNFILLTNKTFLKIHLGDYLSFKKKLFYKIFIPKCIIVRPAEGGAERAEGTDTVRMGRGRRETHEAQKQQAGTLSSPGLGKFRPPTHRVIALPFQQGTEDIWNIWNASAEVQSASLPGYKM